MKTNIVRLVRLLRWSNCLAGDLFLSNRLSKHVPDESRKNRRNADCLSIHSFICLDSRFCLNGHVHISCNCFDFPRPVFKSWTIHIVLTVGSMGQLYWLLDRFPVWHLAEVVSEANEENTIRKKIYQWKYVENILSTDIKENIPQEFIPMPRPRHELKKPIIFHQSSLRVILTWLIPQNPSIKCEIKCFMVSNRFSLKSFDDNVKLTLS